MNFPGTTRQTLSVFVGAAVALSLAACGGGGGGGSAGAKGKIYLDLSYTGNNWQDEGANLATSIATSPEVAKKYEFKKLVSGTDVQKQISDLQSMIGEGAKLIVAYPLSPTALNPVIKEGCRQGVTIVVYDSTVTEPCAYNVAFITGARVDEPDHPFFGAQSALALTELMKGKGNIIMNHGVAGTATDNVHVETAKAVFAKSPGIKIVAETYGNWDSSLSQQEVSKALAAHPDVAGVWTEDGEVGVIKALKAAGMKVPVVGQGGNYFIKQLSEGWPGISAGSPPAQAAVAMKVGLQVIGGDKNVPHNIEFPLPWITNKTAKACPGAEIVDGCNFFPKEEDTFQVEIFQKDLLPESSLTAAKTGEPVAKLQPLPDLAAFEQPAARRVYTRGTCDSGWTEGLVTQGQVPAGLKGCVKK